MNNFEEAALRLKQALKVINDKDAAEFIGMKPVAWSERKKRDSFPTKDVYALAQRRPELKLDAEWIVTGHSAYITTKTKLETTLVESYRICNAQDRAEIDKFVLKISDLLNLSGEEVDRRLAAYEVEIAGYQ